MLLGIQCLLLLVPVFLLAEIGKGEIYPSSLLSNVSLSKGLKRSKEYSKKRSHTEKDRSNRTIKRNAEND